MSDYRIIHPQLGGIPVSQVDTVQRLPLGYKAQAQDINSGTANLGCGQFVYCVGATTSAPTRGDAVFIQNHSLMKIGSASSGSNLPVGIAAGDLSASNRYGWVMVKGFCDFAKMEAATTDTVVGGAAATFFIASTVDGLLATTQTAAGHAIIGIGCTGSVDGSASSAATISNMTVLLNYPQIGMGSAL